MGRTNLPSDIVQGLTAEERGVLGLAGLAAEAARRTHDRTGKWPKTVRT